MHVTHLAGIDLNLLPLLDALLTERHVTRAAESVGLSQPAASRGLGRLRALFDDPLLVRSGPGWALTPRAEALRDPVRRALGLVQGAIESPSPFDPASARRTARLMSDDYSELLLLPGLLDRLTRDAPGIDLWVHPLHRSNVRPLVEGETDFMIMPLREDERLAPGVRAEPLYSDRFVCMVKRGHPLARKPSFERFLAARHAFIAPRSRRGGPVDDALAARGKERRIALAVPHFLVMPFLVASSDLVLTLGERIARRYAQFLPVVLFEPPLSLPGFTIALYWHEKDANDPTLAWVRERIADVARDLPTARKGTRLARRKSGDSRRPFP
jgi:DNA-binding transcriptional LysR family regulator